MTATRKVELETCQQICDDLKQKIQQLRGQTPKNILAQTVGKIQKSRNVPQLRVEFQGHFGKIYALDWGPDSKFLLTASQDGRLIIWQSTTAYKQLAIPLNNDWVMTCGFSPNYELIASGGLDNVVTIHKLNPNKIDVDNNDNNNTNNDDNIESTVRFHDHTVKCTLSKHEGFIASCRFLDDNQVLSASGDSTCILWDIEKKACLHTFNKHEQDVMCIGLNKQNRNLFVSASVDKTVKIWDLKSPGRNVINFDGHTKDVNCVQWFVDGQATISGGDDGNIRMFDLRSLRQINEYVDENNKSIHGQELASGSSVDVSLTGSYLFSSYDNGNVYMWDTLSAEQIDNFKHPNRVSSLAVSKNGYALATGCWDYNMRTYA